jgi:hypothetical protein
MTRIALVHGPDAESIAKLAQRRLTDVGAKVKRRPLAVLEDAAHDVDRIVVLWSRHAAGAEQGLRRVAASGRLTIARLASAPTPPRWRAHVRALPRPRDGDNAWRALAGMRRLTKAERENMGDYPGTRWHALLVVAAMGLLTASAAYASDVGFAARVDAVFAALLP